MHMMPSWDESCGQCTIGSMTANRFLFCTLLSVVLITFVSIQAQPEKISGTAHYFYLTNQRIVTLEIANSQRAVLNYINFGEAFELVDATALLLLDSAGKVHQGHVLEIEDASDPSERYLVNKLISPKKFVGFTVYGRFKSDTALSKAYFRSGGRILDLEPMSQEEFEQAAQMVGRIELDLPDAKAALLKAGFRRGYGSILWAGSPEGDKIDALYSSEEVVAPLLLASPRPLLPKSLSSLPDPVTVEISVLVTRSGGAHDFKVVRASNDEAGKLAVETVRNSWRFLPAISKGKATDARLTLKIIFRRQEE